MGALEELREQLGVLPQEALAQALITAREVVRHRPWNPNPGPQTDAYFSLADVLLFGGQAGGGKSMLTLGIGINEAARGIIFRRELTQTDGLEADGKSVIGKGASFNGTDHEWTWAGGKSLKLGAMQGLEDWISHAGRERDYMAFDEAGEFLEAQVASIGAWLRARPGNRTRMVLASNPPRGSDGMWLLTWFAPWLYPGFPEGAAPGELRWACYLKDDKVADAQKMEWVKGPGIYVFSGQQYTAKSYTFIPASLEDNLYRNTPEYKAQLQSLPEPLRSQLLYGDWQAGLKDGADQTIPGSWARAAIERWNKTDGPPEGIPMCSIGVDCSGGGDDPMVMAPRYDGWYPRLVKVPGAEIPRERGGSFAAGRLLMERRDGALPVVDMGGGYGGPMYEHLIANDIECHAYKGAEATTRRSSDKRLGFVNVRSAAYWGFREALDPDQPGGSPIFLPPDQRLVAGLTAPRFEVTPRGIKVEAKSKREGNVKGVVERLGFSPDEADAVVQAWWAGPKETNSALAWADRKIARGMRGMVPRVITGRQHARR